MVALRQLGTTQQRLLRQLLMANEGGTVESLCAQLRISHNAVRQHLSALIARRYVVRTQSKPSGGRPTACYRLTEEGHALFPRHYGVIATGLLAQLHAQWGDAAMESTLRELGHHLGSQEIAPAPDTQLKDVVHGVAQKLDALGYEATAARHSEEWQIEAFNCVFHALARQYPQVCKFDLAYMEAASGRRVHHMECIVRGGHVCRFRLGALLSGNKDGDAEE